MQMHNFQHSIPRLQHPQPACPVASHQAHAGSFWHHTVNLYSCKDTACVSTSSLTDAFPPLRNQQQQLLTCIVSSFSILSWLGLSLSNTLRTSLSSSTTASVSGAMTWVLKGSFRLVASCRNQHSKNAFCGADAATAQRRPATNTVAYSELFASARGRCGTSVDCASFRN
jgi:hypothetical protein